MNFYIEKWKGNGWKRRNGEDVKNVDLWRQLDYWKKKYDENELFVQFVWVQGHSGNIRNKIAYYMAEIGEYSPWV